MSVYAVFPDTCDYKTIFMEVDSTWQMFHQRDSEIIVVDYLYFFFFKPVFVNISPEIMLWAVTSFFLTTEFISSLFHLDLST